MASRSRGYNHSNDWDPMKEDFDNTTYDAQYPDEDSSGGVNLDHCRLYIRNIPIGLNKDGLTAAFAKFGNLVESFMSPDPIKRYGLVSYETPGEAKVAMMKLNRTGPLNLNITVAHKSKARDNQNRENRNNNRQRSNNEHSNTNSTYNRDRNSYRDDESVSSRGKHSNTWKHDDSLKNDDTMMDNQLEDEMDLESIDPELHDQIDHLRLEELNIQEKKLQMMRKILLNEAEKKRTSNQSLGGINRSILPDGRIVVRNIEKSTDSHDTDGAHGAGGGDSLNIPALQRVASRRCVACCAPADAFCSRCGVTPYCTARCQQRDWNVRHKDVCHNLARLADPPQDVQGAAVNVESIVPVPAPLRRPHSPKRDHVGNGDVATSSRNKKFPPANSRPNNADKMNNSFSKDRMNNSFNKENNIRSDNNDTQARVKNKTDGRRPPLRHENNKREESFDKPTSDFTSKPKETTNYPKTQTAYPKPVEKAEEKKEVKPIQSQFPKVNGVAKSLTHDKAAAEKDMVPKKYLIETLSVGDQVCVTVDSRARECRAKADGFVCASMHDSADAQFQMICEDYVLDCEADKETYTPSPGEPFSYFNPADGAWYRARCLSPTAAALIDTGKIITLSGGDKSKKLTDKYRQVPEFCCLLQADVKIGDNLLATLVSKEGDSYNVTLEDIVNEKSCGKGVLTRWIPEVEKLAPAPIPSTSGVAPPTSPAVGSVPPTPATPRPPVLGDSAVLLVHAAQPAQVFVRARGAAERAHDAILHDVIMQGMDASPLQEPPMPGETVIAKFTDGVHYRALVLRRNIKMDKYLVEYIDFGNQDITKLENLYPCPRSLDVSARATLVSRVALAGCQHAFAERALAYVDKLKEDQIPLILTIPSGEKSLPSGSPVNLTIEQSKESVNNKIEALSTPEWKKMEERGADVLEVKPLMLWDLEYLELPKGACTLAVLDVSMLRSGSVAGCVAGLQHMQYVSGKLSEQMEAYCKSELGREPYLPKVEELCIAQCPPYPQWFRAVVCEQVSGAGGATASVLYVDYGNLEDVACNTLRKMLPEFVRGVPALANTLEIQDFPENPTEEMLFRAIEHLQINDEGRGVLRVSKCVKQDDGSYVVHAPELIAAMKNG